VPSAGNNLEERTSFPQNFYERKERRKKAVSKKRICSHYPFKSKWKEVKLKKVNITDAIHDSRGPRAFLRASI